MKMRRWRRWQPLPSVAPLVTSRRLLMTADRKSRSASWLLFPAPISFCSFLLFLTVKPEKFLKVESTMEDFHNGNEGSFNSDEADNIVKECIEGVVGADDYSQNLVNKWTAGIVERCLTQLVKQGKSYKYIVTCAVMQKTGAGLHTANSCFWDTAMDGSCTVRWENRTMYCVVSVFAVAIA